MYDDVIRKTKKIELLLKKMGAKGKGLQEKVTSIETEIDRNTVKAIRTVASIRNRLVHESGYEMTSKRIGKFNVAYELAVKNLELLILHSKSNSQSKASEYTFSNNVGFDKTYEAQVQNQNNRDKVYHETSKMQTDKKLTKVDLIAASIVAIAAIGLGTFAIKEWIDDTFGV